MNSMLHDLRDCAELMRGRSRLHCLCHELRNLLAGSEPVRRHVEMAATAFFEAITQQFDREEREHLSRQLAAQDIRLAQAAEQRHVAHSRLVNRMEAIHTAFDRRRCERGDEVDGYLHAILEEFLVAWDNYEQAGERLIRNLESR